LTTPAEDYARRISEGELDRDVAQRKTINELERLYREIVAVKPPRGFRRSLARLAGRRSYPVTGVYLWGGVGRGKTFMMDLFFDCLPFKDKERAHFHRFMASVHESLKALGARSNPLELVADEIADRSRIICFDEFSVTDIADAMILGTLFGALFQRGVALATTSNLKPDELYSDGLQRRRFLPAIELIKQHTQVLEVDGLHDYRLRLLERADVYQTPADADADAHLADYFSAIAPDACKPAGEIKVLGRNIRHRGCADGVIWFEFAELCDGPRSQDDYIELSRLYQTVLVSEIPQFDVTLENQARRFIALIDEFYDRRVKLIVAARAAIHDLYKGRLLDHEFERTKSRLQEMQSHEYLSAAHRP
jgi:cell division protein ZapE